MRPETVDKLNELNRKFYSKVAEDFSDSRQYFWKGWNILWDWIELKGLTVGKILDAGSGNGRFAEFLIQRMGNDFEYLGIDYSRDLLGRAKHLASDHIQFDEMDLITDLKKLKGRFELIVLFGVMHHIPGYENRVKLLQGLSKHLTKGGHLVATSWRFDRDKQLFDRKLSWNDSGLDESDLENGDFLLDWRRKKQARRYVHLALPEEQESLVNDSGLEIKYHFEADGKEGNLNRYVILCKKH
ncbi:MAG: class I SAM-dependent methyltransferase [Candidatus Dojkabacteria bacterium]